MVEHKQAFLQVLTSYDVEHNMHPFPASAKCHTLNITTLENIPVDPI